MSHFEVSEPTSARITVRELAELIQGEVEGPGETFITNPCPLEDPRPGGLAFLRNLPSAKVADRLQSTPLAALLIGSKVELAAPPGLALIRVQNPLVAFSTAVRVFVKPPRLAPGIHPSAVIEDHVSIGDRVSIGAFSYVAAGCTLEEDVQIFPRVTLYPGVHIGRGTVIHSGAVLREGVSLGSGCVIQPGAVIGGDGFGYVPDSRGELHTVPQIGTVTIGSRVDIGALTCIDRATLGSTIIGDYTKVDNLVQIGHNCKIGRKVIICGQVGIAGSCTINDGVVLGGQSGLADHLTIVSGVRVGAKSGVTSHLTEKGDYGGFPAQPIQLWRRQIAALRNLPRLLRSLRGRQSALSGESSPEETDTASDTKPAVNKGDIL